MADLIFSRRADAKPMSLEEIERRAPAVFATDHAAHLSDRYGQVTTREAIDILADFNFAPVQAAQKIARGKTRLEHAEHMLAFAPIGAPIEETEARPEIVLYNAHDGRAALKMFAGAFRFICSNGIVAGDGFSGKMRHTSGTVSGFEDMLREIAGLLPEMMDKIRRWQSLAVTERQERELAEAAASLRWKKMPRYSYDMTDAGFSIVDAETGEALRGAYYTADTLEGMINPIRRQDAPSDFWHAFNRIQEKTMRGGVDVLSISSKYPEGRNRSARPLQSVGGNVKANAALWNIADYLGAIFGPSQ